MSFRHRPRCLGPQITDDVEGGCLSSEGLGRRWRWARNRLRPLCLFTGWVHRLSDRWPQTIDQGGGDYQEMRKIPKRVCDSGNQHKFRVLFLEPYSQPQSCCLIVSQNSKSRENWSWRAPVAAIGRL